MIIFFIPEMMVTLSAVETIRDRGLDVMFMHTMRKIFLCTYLFLSTVQSFAMYLGKQLIHTYLCYGLLWCKVPAVWTASKAILGAEIYPQDLIKTSFTSLVFCIQGIMSWSSCLSISLSVYLPKSNVCKCTCRPG